MAILVGPSAGNIFGNYAQDAVTTNSYNLQFTPQLKNVGTVNTQQVNPSDPSWDFLAFLAFDFLEGNTYSSHQSHITTTYRYVTENILRADYR